MALFLTQNLFVASGIDYLIYHAAVDTIGAFVGVESDSGQRTGSRAGGRLVQGGARGHRPQRARSPSSAKATRAPIRPRPLPSMELNWKS